jgi:hypothetical protein
MQRRPYDEIRDGYRPDRPLFVRSETSLRNQLIRAAAARRLIKDAPNRARAIEALGPLRRAASALN